MSISPAVHPSIAAANDSSQVPLSITRRQNRWRAIAGLPVTTLLLALGACKTIVVDSGGDVVDSQREANNVRAIAATTRELAANPKDADAYLVRADAEEEKGDYLKAIADCDRSIALNSTRSVAFSIRANAKDALGDFEGAIADYDRASALHPTGATSFEYDSMGGDQQMIKVVPIDAKSMFAHTLKRDPYVEPRAFAVAGRAMNGADRAIARNSQDSAAFTARGIAKVARDDCPGALADLNRAIALNPNDAAAFSHRGLIRYLQSHFVDARSADHQAISAATQAITRDPNDAAAYAARGSYEQSVGEHDRALADFERAIALRPDYAGNFIYRGIFRKAQGDYPGALADFNHAIALADRTIAADSKNAHALANRANAKKEAGDLRGAIADFGRALAANPDDADILFNRGLAKHEAGDSRGALADFEHADEILLEKKTHPGTRVITRSATVVRDAIDRDPNHPRGFGLRGAFRYQDGDRQGGVDDIAHALALVISDSDRFVPRFWDHAKPVTDSSGDDRFVNRGTLRFEKSGHDDAIADYDRAIALNPNVVATYFQRGVAKQEEADDEGALADYDRAVALVPDESDALINRGIIKSKRGDYDGVIADYDRVIALHPDYSDVYDGRSGAKRRKGDAAGADADLKIELDLVKDHPGDPFFGGFASMRRPNPLKPFIENSSAPKSTSSR